MGMCKWFCVRLVIMINREGHHLKNVTGQRYTDDIHEVYHLRTFDNKPLQVP